MPRIPHFTTALAVSVVAIIAVLGLYTFHFDSNFSPEHEDWGVFGSYVGGTLGAIFSALAFLILAATLELQHRELKDASVALKGQIETQRVESLSRDYMDAFKDVDVRLEKILSKTIKIQDCDTSLTISEMALEADRAANYGEANEAYAAFLEQARTRGTPIEASIRELLAVLADFKHLLNEYLLRQAQLSSPLIQYYAKKIYRVAHLVEDIGHPDIDSGNPDAGIRAALGRAMSGNSSGIPSADA